MFGGRSARPSKQETKYYDLLELQPGASVDEIKKSYRRAAMRWHPDRHQDEKAKAEAEVKFKEITKAYEVLSDEKKRQLYDQYGEEGVQQGGGGGSPFGDAGDIFSQMFGMGGGGRGRQEERRTADIQFPLALQLADFYRGKTKKLKITRKKLCGPCGGKGSDRPGAVQTCTTCKGQGVRVVLKRLGPGMVQQMQMACDECGGEGKKVRPEDACPSCRGRKTVEEGKILEVEVRPGMVPGQVVTFYNSADEEFGKETGDVQIVLKASDDDPRALAEDLSGENADQSPTLGVKASVEPLQHKFRRLRNGHDLVMFHHVELVEALTGFRHAFEHLDGHVFIVESPPGQVLTQDCYLSVEREGMPRQSNPTQRGDLLVHIKIRMPQAAELEKLGLDKLRAALPPSRHAVNADEAVYKRRRVEDGELEDADHHVAAMFDPARKQEQEDEERQEAYDEDHQHQQGGAQCRQM